MIQRSCSFLDKDIPRCLVKLRVSLWVSLREQLLANALVPKIGMNQQ